MFKHSLEMFRLVKVGVRGGKFLLYKNGGIRCSEAFR